MDRSPPVGSVAVLGAGRSSVVLSLHLAEWADVVDGVIDDSNDNAQSDRRIAMRLSKRGSQAPVEDACVRTMLRPYVGFVQWATVSNAFKARFDALTDLPLSRGMELDALKQLVRHASVAMLMPDFSWAPHPLRVPPMLPALGTRHAASALVQRKTIEIKPKGAWQPPRFVAARYRRRDGTVVERTVHPTKLHRCRFSMMQEWKWRNRKAQFTSIAKTETSSQSGVLPATPSTYCPNDLLYPSNGSVALALADLMHTPENNLKVVAVQPPSTFVAAADAASVLRLEPDGSGTLCASMDVVDAKIIGLVLSRLDVCQRLVDLQLADMAVGAAASGGALTPVLDVSLLHLWASYLDEVANGSSDFQLCHAVGPVPGSALAVRCSCHGHKASPPPSTFVWSEVPHQWVTPAFAYADALERFYVATTAKDVSFLFTVERACGDGDALQRLLDAKAMQMGVVADETSECDNSAVSLSLVVDDANLVDADAATGQGGRLVVARCRTAVVDIDSKRHKGLGHYFEQDRGICEAADAAAALS